MFAEIRLPSVPVNELGPFAAPLTRYGRPGNVCSFHFAFAEVAAEKLRQASMFVGTDSPCIDRLPVFNNSGLVERRWRTLQNMDETKKR